MQVILARQILFSLLVAAIPALLPETFRKLLSVEIEFRPLASTIPAFDFHIAWHRDNESSLLYAFLEMAREHVRAEAEAAKKLH
jgi:hypothetical protein